MLQKMELVPTLHNNILSIILIHSRYHKSYRSVIWWCKCWYF